MDGPCGRRSNASCKVPPQRPGTRDHDPRHEGGTLADQNFQLLIKHVRRRAEESRQKHLCVCTALHETRRPMQRDDGFACPSGPGHAGWTWKVALDGVALRWMQKDRPLFPRKFQSAVQLFGILNDAKSTQRVGMGDCTRRHFKGRHPRGGHLADSGHVDAYPTCRK